jgi:hypothetical protein
MPNEMTLAAQNTPRKVRALRQVADRRKSGTARPLANEVAPGRGATTRPIEPMLLVYQEQAETFRLIAVALRRGSEALARWLAA